MKKTLVTQVVPTALAAPLDPLFPLGSQLPDFLGLAVGEPRQSTKDGGRGSQTSISPDSVPAESPHSACVPCQEVTALLKAALSMGLLPLGVPMTSLSPPSLELGVNTVSGYCIDPNLGVTGSFQNDLLLAGSLLLKGLDL